MYTEKTLRGLARSLCALVLVLVITCIVMFFAASKALASGAEVTASADSYTSSDSGSSETVIETTQPETASAPQAHAWVMQVAGVPYYYNWEIQDDGIQNDRNFGKNLWDESLTTEEAFKLFMTHMSTDPRACAATALGLSKELGFSVMTDEQSISNETERVNVAALHYADDHDYWQADFNTMMSAVYELQYGIEEIGEYSSACYMIFNGYGVPPTVIVSPSTRTGGHALVFYKGDGSKIRFRLECSFQLVDVLIVTETEPEPDIPETTTTPATTTTVETTTTAVTTTVETTQPTTTSATESTTVSTTTTTTTAPETTTTTRPTTESTTTTTTKATTTTSTTQATTTQPTTESTTQPTTESTTPESTTSTIESTTTTSTTTSQTTTETATTQPETTTTLESKDPEQAPDVTDDSDLGGDVDSTDVNTDASPEPDLPGTPTTSANPSASASGAEQAPVQTNTSLPQTNATLPPRDGMTVVQQVLEALN